MLISKFRPKPLQCNCKMCKRPDYNKRTKKSFTRGANHYRDEKMKLRVRQLRRARINDDGEVKLPNPVGYTD